MWRRISIVLKLPSNKCKVFMVHCMSFSYLFLWILCCKFIKENCERFKNFDTNVTPLRDCHIVFFLLLSSLGKGAPCLSWISWSHQCSADTRPLYLCHSCGYLTGIRCSYCFSWRGTGNGKTVCRVWVLILPLIFNMLLQKLQIALSYWPRDGMTIWSGRMYCSMPKQSLQDRVNVNCRSYLISTIRVNSFRTLSMHALPP